MSRDQLVLRLLCAHTGLDSHRLRTGNIEEGEWAKVAEAMSVLADMPIYIDDTPGISVMELRTKARRMQAEHDIGFIVVDYLQLMQGRASDNRVQEVSEISRALKGLARELNVPVLALSQLSRAVESRPGNKPQLSDLRDSGSIEQDADVVMFIYRAEMYDKETAPKNVAEVIVAKHRNGPTGDIELFFSPRLTRFSDLEQRYTSPYS
jgi:replicative DNA helicase